MSTVIEEFVAKLGWDVDQKGLDKFNDQVADIGKMFAVAGAAIVGASTAVIAFTAHTARATATQTNLARALGVSSESLENWGYLLGSIGFTGESVLKMTKDLNNRIGMVKANIGEASTIKDAFKAIGLSISDFDGKTAEQQLNLVLNASKKTKDTQVGMAAAYTILGREGSKMVGHLKHLDGTVEELLEKQNSFNLLTEEARDNSIAFQDSLENLDATIDSSGRLFAGFMSSILNPLLATFLDFVAANKELIQQDIKKWADRIGSSLVWMYNKMRSVKDMIDPVIKKLGGIENVFKLIGLATKSMFAGKIVLAFVALLNKAAAKALLLNIKLFALPLLIGAGVVALGLLSEDFYTFVDGGQSVFGDFLLQLGLAPAEIENIRLAFALTFDFIAIYGEAAFNSFMDNIVGMSNFFVSWAETIAAIFSVIVAVFQGDFEYIKNLGKSAVDYLIDKFRAFQTFVVNIPNEIKKAFSDIPGTIKKMVSKIPGVGGLIEGDIKKVVRDMPLIGGNVEGFVSNFEDIADRKAGKGFYNSGVRPSNDVINNANNKSQSNNVTQNNTINAPAAGSTGQNDFMDRMNKAMDEQSIKLFKNLSTQVQY